jgi:hypothetical protein
VVVVGVVEVEVLDGGVNVDVDEVTDAVVELDGIDEVVVEIGGWLEVVGVVPSSPKNLTISVRSVIIE